MTPAREASVAYLHIGAPKTGTTFVQQVLWQNRTHLLRQGVALPGRGFSDHFRATQDLRGRRQEAASRTPSWEGEWDALARQVRRARTPRAVISCEMLAPCGPNQIQRAVASLAPLDVHVIYTVRDLAALLPAAYQENVKHRSPRGFDEWLAEVVDSGHSGNAGRWFWRVHDPVDVLGRWSATLPPERIHVVTVPQTGGSPDRLWQRFASVLGIDPGSADTSATRPNASLGRAEIEVLRRVNAALDPSVPLWHYASSVKDGLAHEVLAGRADRQRLLLPADRRAWVQECAEYFVRGLRSGGYDVVGDLDELLPLAAPDGTDAGSREVTDAEMLAAAVDGLAGWVQVSLRERTELPASEVIKRAALDLGSRSRPARVAASLYRRLALRLRRP